MKVNYVLMYGIPYVRYREFEKFDDISKFLLHKGYCTYTIFEKMNDSKEIEMIHLQNDIRFLEDLVKKQDQEIKQLKIEKKSLLNTHYGLKESIKMLFCNDRKELAEEYMKWIEQEKISNCPFNVITFLELKDLLNREKVIKFLESKGESD